MDYMQIIGTIGFPIAMCLWFMFRLEKALDRLSSAISRCPYKEEKKILT